MSNEAVEYVRGIPVVKTFGQSVFSFKRFKASIENYEKWVISNGVTDEFLLNLIFYIIITPIITVTLNKIMFSSENAMIVEDAITRMNGIMNLEPISEEKKPALPKDASITFENVSFCYTDAKQDAIHDISLNLYFRTVNF